MTTAQRITTKQILNAIGCKHLNLYKGSGYYYFSYDDGKQRYETHSVVVCALSHLSLENWIAEGRELVARMEPAEKQPGDYMLERLRARREALSREPNGCYVHEAELQELWNREQEIERGQEALRRAEFYFEHTKENSYEWRSFTNAFFDADKKNGY
jgi:hypothetical protein